MTRLGSLVYIAIEFQVWNSMKSTCAALIRGADRVVLDMGGHPFGGRPPRHSEHVVL
jgi:hypothetical protein